MTDDELEELSYSALEELLGCGVERRTLLRYFKTIRNRATPAPAQPGPLHVANERGEGWQPIESVPKSPVPVLLFTRGGIVRIETGWYAVNLLAEAIENGEECAFTHWAPLPAAPKEKP